MAYLGLIIQDFYLNILWILVILSIAGILYILFHQILKPYMEMRANEVPFPPEIGDTFEFVVNESDRNASFIIGRTMGNLVTKCSAISENHLTFIFKKNPQNEEYDIQIKKGGPTLFKPPRMATYTVMESTEKLESHEIIGKSADFRISGQLVKERMVNYIEISFTSKFFINKMGKERLLFIFKIEKIQPGFNLQSEDANGNFPFGREEHGKEGGEQDFS